MTATNVNRDQVHFEVDGAKIEAKRDARLQRAEERKQR
jgi:hypothetical protein